MKKRKNAKRWLLLIPAQAILSVLIIIAGIFGDVIFLGKLEGSGNGHPAPVFTIFGFLIAFGLFFCVTIISIVITVVATRKVT